MLCFAMLRGQQSDLAICSLDRARLATAARRSDSLVHGGSEPVVCGKCRDVVRMLHLQSWLDLGGTMSSIGSDLLKVFTAGEVTG
jgi:hypothetical protein